MKRFVLLVVLAVMLSGCGYTVVEYSQRPVPPTRVYFYDPVVGYWWGGWYSFGYPYGYYRHHVVVPRAPLKVQPAPQHREQQAPRRTGNHR